MASAEEEREKEWGAGATAKGSIGETWKKWVRREDLTTRGAIAVLVLNCWGWLPLGVFVAGFIDR